jgi:hypothetical protein
MMEPQTVTPMRNIYPSRRYTFDPFIRGQLFEHFVRRHLFPREVFYLLNRAGYYYRGITPYRASVANPDFLFLDERTCRDFYVEVKFRKDIGTGEIRWTDRDQLNRYQLINRKRPTFLLLGLGDNPLYPTSLALVPMARAKYVSIYRREIKNFSIPLDRPISSD